MFYFIIVKFIRNIFLLRGRHRFWDRKSLLIFLIGYVLGNILSELYEYSYTSQVGGRTRDFVPKQTIHNSFTYTNLKANNLKKNFKILCLVMTTPDNHQTKARHVLRTWGKRCNKIIIMSSARENEIPEIVVLPVNEGRHNLWQKTIAAFTYIYNLYLDEYDWFLKADDDTYVVVENLRLLLINHDSKTPIFFGFKISSTFKQVYMSGGAGYVLSKEALRRFIEVSLSNSKFCNSNISGAEDIEIGRCLINVDVIAGDSRDTNKRGRFFVFPLEYHLLAADKIPPNNWYWKYMYYKTKDGLTCCSDYAISFHYVQPTQMYILDYLIYRTKIYGVKTDYRKLLNQTAT